MELTPEQLNLLIGGIAGAIATLVGAIVLFLKTWSEIKQVKTHSATTAHEVTHNSGSSMKDMLLDVKDSVGELRDDVRCLREEKRLDHADMRSRLQLLESIRTIDLVQ